MLTQDRQDLDENGLPGTNAGMFDRYAEQFPTAHERRRYTRGMVRFWLALMRHDDAAFYVPFVLTYSGRCSREEAMRRFFQACVNAGRTVFPELSRSSRHHLDNTFGVMLLRAVSASGLVHYHGFIRVPKLAVRDARLTPIVIQQSLAMMVIEGPPCLKVFVDCLRDLFHPRRGVSTSLWIANEWGPGQSRAEAVNHVSHPRTIVRQLHYLQRTRDGEVRDWTTAEHLPDRLFKRIAQS